MKSLLFFCASVLLSQLPQLGYGQPATAGLLLSYEYHNMGSGTRQNINVYVKGAESLSKFSASEPLAGTNSESNDFSISGEDSLGRQVYRNLATRNLVFRDFAPVNGEFQAFIVRDPWVDMKWAFHREQRTLGDYLCNKATTDFRGRTYEAWYTGQIPVGHGPWKFAGLPGAIVELRSMDNLILFRLLRIESLGNQPIRMPNAGTNASMVEYVSLKKEAINDFVRALKAKLPRGAEVSVETTGDYNLETDFSDIKK